MTYRTRKRRMFRGMAWGIGIPAALLLILFIAAFFIDAPLRRYMERGMNEALDGYSVQLGEVDFHPVGLSITVRDLVLRQDAHPEAPVARFPEITASVHWRELLTGNLVSDWRLDRPQLHIDLQQLRAEEKDETPVEKRGWQEAIQHIYPLQINRLEIRDGTLTYIDQDPQKPLELAKVQLTAGNIRNIHSPERTYPSPFRLEATIFEKGYGIVEGDADFLAGPHPGIAADIRLRQVPLERLQPVTARANVHLSGGIVSGDGHLEYSPAVRRAHLADLAIDGLTIDYVHSAVTAEEEARRAKKAKEALQEAKRSEWQIQVDNLHLTRGGLGFVNRAEVPDYRISLDAADLRVKNFSNRFRAGAAEFRLEGEFMHSGDAFATAVFRPAEAGPDFDLLVAIEGTRVTEMNDLLRAHAGLDVVAGSFSLYSEIRVRGDRIEGYAKPLFKDLDIYDPQQEKGQGLIGKLKEGIAGALSALLKNPQEKVATQFDLSGTLDNPDADTGQIVAELIRNAFFEAILPGFEERSGRKKEKRE